ncbi:MAG: hypothetical protein GX847_02995, partial [Clostridiales bacterium]|nr:hypothetical protein [Clostridiales bacterium]
MIDFLITLLSLSVLGSVLAIILLLLKPLIRNRVSKAFSYYLWIIVLLRLCLPPGISLTVPAGWFSGPSEITETQPIYDTNTGGFISDQSGKIEPGPLENTQGAAVGTPGLSGGVAVSPEIGGNYTTSTGGTVQTIGAWLGNPAFWFMIWAFGALLSLIWHVFGYIRFAGMLRRSAEAPDAAELTVFREFSGSGRVRLVRSGFVKTPMLLGLLRPVIILPPVSYIRSGGADDLRDILRHELIHYRRRDLLYKWFAMLVTCLHWFNP